MPESFGIVETVTAIVTPGNLVRFTLFDLFVTVSITLIGLYFLGRFAWRRSSWKKNTLS